MAFLVLVLWCSAAIAGCRSRVIAVTVVNGGTAVVKNIELDYPGGSFGINSLAPGAKFEYRIKVLREGKVSLQFEDGQGRSLKTLGPRMTSSMDGVLRAEIGSGAAPINDRVKWSSSYVYP